MYLTILKWVALLALIVGLAYATHKWGFDDGYNAAEVVALKAQNKAKDDAEAVLAERDAAHLETLERIQHAKAETIKKLNTDVAKLAGRGLFVTVPSCPPPGLREAGGASEPVSGASKYRLHGTVEQDLISLAENADRVLLQYESCRAELRGLVTVLPE